MYRGCQHGVCKDRCCKESSSKLALLGSGSIGWFVPVCGTVMLLVSACGERCWGLSYRVTTCGWDKWACKGRAAVSGQKTALVAIAMK